MKPLTGRDRTEDGSRGPGQIRRTLGSILLIVVLMVIGTRGDAQNVIRIAAVVNDEIISAFDLQNRIRLILATTALPNNPDVIRRITPQVLRTMIDERIQLQEAEQQNVRVSQAELERTLSNLERQNNMPPGELNRMLRAHGIDRSALEGQIRTKIAWAKLINRRLMRQISIGPDEIREEIERLKALEGKPRMRAFEIFLSVDGPEQEAQVRQTAERLLTQIVNGAKFTALANEFSQSTSAARGGDLGWVTEGELDDKLANVLGQMQPGQLSQPIRTLTGYHILYLQDRRIGNQTSPEDITLEYRTMLLPVPQAAPESEFAAQQDIAGRVTQNADSCDEFVRIGRSVGGQNMEEMFRSTAGSVPSELGSRMLQAEVGKPSEPIRTPEGFLIVVVCDRSQEGRDIPTPEAVEERLRRERLDLMAQRYLRDLRRAAFVDIRQ